MRLVGTAHDAETDSLGSYRIENVPAGRYTTTFTHPRVDSLGYVPEPLAVEVAATADEAVPLTIPSLPVVLAAACPVESEEGNGVVVGTVHNLASMSTSPTRR